MLPVDIYPHLEPEIWQPLETLNYHCYDISSYGKVRNHSTGRMIKPTIRPSGYYRTAIIDKEGKRSTLSIHILVAEIFIGSYELSTLGFQINRSY